MYDTAYVSKLNERDEETEWYVPTKYALTLDEGRTDAGILAQIHAYSDEYMTKAIWFECQRDIHQAIQLLKEKHPGLKLGSKIGFTIDFPLHRERIRETGATVVEPILRSEKKGFVQA